LGKIKYFQILRSPVKINYFLRFSVVDRLPGKMILSENICQNDHKNDFSILGKNGLFEKSSFLSLVPAKIMAFYLILLKKYNPERTIESRIFFFINNPQQV
jgi:hypothetical protein